ncbi:hypothetical protein FO470_01775 [Starkeya sp. 3C]|uniref:Uncharacterized protein n=2 Tax=Ancylobacter moscoviensis TaxID=2597768 RepID=A0ABY3DUN9_9HYPH|nr:hypothetical protein FO470_01775 [Ancylobacter moscoviensis]
MDDPIRDRAHHRAAMTDPILSSNTRRRRHPLRVALGFVFRALCAVVIILDELVRPIYRPLIARIAALRIMHSFERWVGGLHPLVILVLLAIPYAIVEPLKFVGLLWIANGAGRSGTVLFLAAHLVSFVLIERIFSAGRSKLMTIGWMAWVIDTANAVRRRITLALHLDEMKESLRRMAHRLRLRLRALLR